MDWNDVSTDRLTQAIENGRLTRRQMNQALTSVGFITRSLQFKFELSASFTSLGGDTLGGLNHRLHADRFHGMQNSLDDRLLKSDATEQTAVLFLDLFLL